MSARATVKTARRGADAGLPAAATKENARQIVVGPQIPVITNLKKDLSVDLDGIRFNVNYLVEHGIVTGKAVLLAVGAGGDFDVLTLEERVSEFVQSFLDLEWFRITGGDPRVRGSYHVYHCDASGLQWQERAASRPMAGILHTARGSIYPLKGETIGVTLYVFSRPETFEDNRKALHRMAATLSSGEVFTTRVYGR